MTFSGELRDYQHEAAEKMLDRGRVLLAYPMGAGKTPVTLYVTESLREEFGESFQILIITTGLKRQWRDFICQFTGGHQEGVGRKKKWVGGVPSIVIEGTPERRAKLYEQALAGAAPYVIVGYEQVVSDYSMVQLLATASECLVGDEITAIKNPEAARTQALKTIDAPFVYGLTGDPIENGKPEELFSIMEWVDDTVLGDPEVFERAFIVRHPKRGYVLKHKNIPAFRKMLEPALARISEDDPRLTKYMPKSLPVRTHWVTLDEGTARLYDYIRQELQVLLAEAAKMKGDGFDLYAHYAGTGDKDARAMQGKLMARISALRQLCDDPDLLIDSALRYIASEDEPKVMVTKVARDGRKYQVAKARPGSAYAAYLYDVGLLDGLDSAPKIEAVIKRINRVLREDPKNKIIVFCTYKGVIRSLKVRYGTSAVEYSGDQTPNQRSTNKAAFQNEAKVRLFLSSDAGGYGVDLPQANYLFNIDRPYSAGKKKQRNTRHRRANLTWWTEIHVENWSVEGSIEEYYDAKLAQKTLIAAAIMDGKGYGRSGEIEMSATSLGQFLADNDYIPFLDWSEAEEA